MVKFFLFHFNSSNQTSPLDCSPVPSVNFCPLFKLSLQNSRVAILSVFFTLPWWIEKKSIATFSRFFFTKLQKKGNGKKSLLLHNFWSYWSIDPFNISKWPSEPQFSFVKDIYRTRAIITRHTIFVHIFVFLFCSNLLHKCSWRFKSESKAVTLNKTFTNPIGMFMGFYPTIDWSKYVVVSSNGCCMLHCLVWLLKVWYIGYLSYDSSRVRYLSSTGSRE